MSRVRTAWLLFAAVSTLSCRAGNAPPEKVFAPWNGVWEGRFVVKDGERLLTELRVRQRYWSERPGLQHGRFREVDLDTQKVVTATAVNERLGSMLRCTVEKSNGERVVHQGRSRHGGIEWSRKTDDVKEYFFERVVQEGDRSYYTIEGWGRYGEGPRLTFEGRYRKVGSEAEARPSPP